MPNSPGIEVVTLALVGVGAAAFLLIVLVSPDAAFALGWYVATIRGLPRRLRSRAGVWCTWAECEVFKWWWRVALAWSERIRRGAGVAQGDDRGV